MAKTFNEALGEDYERMKRWNDRRAKSEQDGIKNFWEAYGYWEKKKEETRVKKLNNIELKL